jgi:hypothetical protein
MHIQIRILKWPQMHSQINLHMCLNTGSQADTHASTQEPDTVLSVLQVLVIEERVNEQWGSDSSWGLQFLTCVLRLP